MAWESRNYDAGPRESSRFRAVLRRIFGNGENPFDWALPLYTAWGIRVRVHLVFVIMIIAEVIAGLNKNEISWDLRLLGMGSLFILVLLHEYGHCIACRRVGGSADQILIWPLGGLAFCVPPHNWRADLITTLGGPAVNALLAPVFAGALLALGQGWHAVFFNPFRPGFILGGLHLADNTRPFWLVALWWLYYTNGALFLFNMLLPMYPMDAGRVVHAMLWRSMGHRRATDAVTKIGMGVALILVVLGGALENQSMLILLGLFGGLTCWMERRRLAMTAGDPALAGYDFDRRYAGLPPEDEPEDARAERARAKQRKKEQEDQAELDRILAKIATSGMGSLTKSEKRWLERATERRRRG